jgi:hypothetical protein
MGGGIASLGSADSDSLTEIGASIIFGNSGGDVGLLFSSANSFNSLGNNLIGDVGNTGSTFRMA